MISFLPVKLKLTIMAANKKKEVVYYITIYIALTDFLVIIILVFLEMAERQVASQDSN